jgi:hypothetical protein
MIHVQLLYVLCTSVLGYCALGVRMAIASRDALWAVAALSSGDQGDKRKCRPSISHVRCRLEVAYRFGVR